MSLRITPAASHATSTTNTAPSKLTNTASHLTYPTAPSAPGLPDTLRASLQSTTSPSNPTSTPAQLTSTHPLEARLANWAATQQQLHQNLLRRTHGLADPLRRGMELQMVRKSDSFRPSALGPASGVHDDILSGRDMDIAWEDVYAGQDGLRGAEGVSGDGQGVDGGLDWGDGEDGWDGEVVKSRHIRFVR